VTTVFRNRRREERRAAELARLLVALEAMARDERPWRPRRVLRVALGSAR
jgi:hypothetical protein